MFGKGYTGGPHNFGDPNDRSMRHVEDNIFVTQIIRNRGMPIFYLYVDLLCIQTLIYSYFIGHIAKPAHHEKCKDFVKSNEFAADLYNAAPLIY